MDGLFHPILILLYSHRGAKTQRRGCARTCAISFCPFSVVTGLSDGWAFPPHSYFALFTQRRKDAEKRLCTYVCNLFLSFFSCNGLVRWMGFSTPFLFCFIHTEAQRRREEAVHVRVQSLFVLFQL